MTEDEIFAKLRTVIAETLDLDDDVAVTAATSANDVPGWDSVAHVQLMVSVEAAFGIRFRTSDMAGMENVQDLVRRIAHRL